MESQQTGDRSFPIIASVEESCRGEDMSVEQTAQYTVDDALTFIGHGTAQRFLLVVLGVGCATFSANIVLMSYVEPNVSQTALQQQSALTLVARLGMAVGSNTWGAVADRYGRKVGTLLSLIVEGIAGVIASVAPSYAVLIAARAIVGVGVGGLATSFSTYSEFLPTAYRGYGLCWYQFFWALGAVGEAAAAWIVVPWHGWRALTLVTAMPSLAILPLVAAIPESPRYLIVTGREDRAKGVLEKIARINRSTLPTGSLKPLSTPSTTPNCCRQISSLFMRPLHRITPIVWFLSFTLGVGYYGTVILTAAVRTDDDEDDACTDGEAELRDDDYFSILIDASAEVPGVLLALFTIERLGRVRSLLLSWCICWSSMLLLLFLPSAKTVFLFGARLATAFTDIFIFVITPELYPSSARCFAMGAMSGVSQLGGTLSPFIARALLDVAGLKAVCALLASLFFVADVASFFLLPFETAGRPMRDDANDLHSDSIYATLNDGGAEP